MALDKVTKQPYEVFWVSSSFANDLGATEGIDSVAITAVDSAGTVSTDIVLVPATPTITGQICYVQVQAGTVALSPYKITFRIISDETPENKWENDISLVIKEL